KKKRKEEGKRRGRKRKRRRRSVMSFCAEKPLENPDPICQGRRKRCFLVQLDAEGSYQCSTTGLVFEVTSAARITYSLLSWSRFAQLVQKPWVVGGPLFDVRCSAPGALLSIHFPHCLCLQG
ncbi:NLR1A protein, partial [Irena cyanogastra]|nr:NLR1A protein [Irena cyanogastra]